MPFHVSNFTKSRREALNNSPFAQHLRFAQRLLFRIKKTGVLCSYRLRAPGAGLLSSWAWSFPLFLLNIGGAVLPLPSLVVATIKSRRESIGGEHANDQHHVACAVFWPLLPPSGSC